MDEHQMFNVIGSSSNSCSKNHDVFLSFRGEDTRWNFTSHLYEALNKENVKTYIDDQLEKGDEISPALTKAIKDSRVSIVIFSENYASSKWCLGELNQILKCREKSGQIVIPVFYMVDPSDVRKQSGSYKRAFVKHEGDHRCKQWKADLTKAANLAGYHSQNYRTQPEFLKKIVEDLLQNLAPRHPIHLKGLVGIEESLAKIESLLKLESSEYITLGIWGMGGIGKTTLATALYDKLSNEFEGHCFLTNVRESSHKLIALQEELFSKLLRKEDRYFNLCDIYMLRDKKVLVVLDDVTTMDQFEKLIKEYDFLGPDSRVVVTTRDKHILGPNDKIYSVQALDFPHSLQIFCLNAFGEKVPKDGYEELSRRVISYCRRVPLALKVLGANLRLRSKEAWECELRKLQRIQNTEIHNVLKLSYDGLDGPQKEIFLDIAYFFKQQSRDFVTSVLETFDFHPESGIDVLLDKALITISKYNEIEMHDLIQEMGWGIIQEESTEGIGRQRRLWKHEEVFEVLKYNKGTDVVEGIILDLFKLTGVLNVNFNSLAKMTNLRFLKIYGERKYKYSCNVYLTNDLNESLNKLRYLRWDGYNLEYFPSNFCVEQLVVLHMNYSNLKKLWSGVQNLVNLKEITLSFSEYLIEIPDLSMAENLEKVNLHCCTGLHQLHPSILSCPKLTYLDLSYCRKIERLNFHSKSMRELYLTNCSSLKEISLTSKDLTVVDLSGCKVIESGFLCSKSLTELNLNGCSSLKEISLTSEEMTSLDLSGTAIRALSLLSCPELECLNLTNCKFIERVNLHLRSLTTLYLDGCSSLKEISVRAEEIIRVDLSGCKLIESLNLHSKSLKELHLGGWSFFNEISVASKNIKELKFPSATIPALSLSIGHSLSLEVLDLTGSNIESFSANIKNLSMLKELCLRDCRKLVSLPELPPSLRVLELDDCRKLISLSELPSNLYKLSAFNCISMEKGIFQQVVLQHMLQRYIPCVHQRSRNFSGFYRNYFVFPRDHVMDECGVHTESSIVIPYLPISQLSGFIYCVILSKKYVFDDFEVFMYQDEEGSSSRKEYKSCHNPISDHVMYWYDDISRYDKISSKVHYHSRDITFTFEVKKRRPKKFGVFPVYATASGFKLEIC